MGSIKKNLITTTTTTTTTKQNKTHAYFPIYSLSLIFKVTARAACLLTYLVLTLVLFTERYASVNSSCAQPPPPPPPLGYCGALAHLFSPGVGHLQISRCSGAGHLTSPGLFPALDTHAVSCQHITTQRILLEKTQIGSSVKDRGL